MSKITAADVEKLNQLQLRWREIRMRKLQQRLSNLSGQYAENCAELYEEMFGDRLTVIKSEYVREENYSGYEMRFAGREYVSEQRLVVFQEAFAEKYNHTMDFKIYLNNEFEIFAMLD